MLVLIKQKISVLFVFAVALFVAISDEAGAQGTNKKELVSKVEETSVTTADGWRIAMTYYQSNAGKEAPVVILLHGKGGNRLAWNAGFAKQLHSQGYAVVTVDLRKHGESRPAFGGETSFKTSSKPQKGVGKLNKFDYQRMVAYDLEAVKSFLLNEHEEQRLNIKKLGIVGADMSTVIALNYAVHDWLKKPYNDAPTFAARTPRGQDIRAIALLSPIESVTGMPSNKAVMVLRNPLFRIAFLTCVGEKDTKSKREAIKIHKQLTSNARNKDHIHQQIYSDRKFRGTDLLSSKLAVDKKIKPQTLMLGFFNKYLKGLNTPWRSRKNKIDN